MKLDAVDLKILHCLQEDGRISNLDLAVKVFLSPSSCLRRVCMLEERGMISRYGAILNAAMLGLEVDAFVLERLYKTAGMLDIRSNIVLQTLKDSHIIPTDLLATPER